VTPSDVWRLDEALFLASRARWIERDHPTQAQIAALHDWVLDCMLDPSKAGRPDPSVEGIWIGWPERGTIVLYGLNTKERLVAVFEIGSSA
jgi:hypothetical protein